MEQNIDRIIKIAKLFYKEKMSKTEIARMEKIPRSQVAQLLNMAEEKGIVNIQIYESEQKNDFLQCWIETYFSLITCHVIRNFDNAITGKDILLDQIRKDLTGQNFKELCMGVDSKGLTYQVIRQYLEKFPRNNMKIVSLTGTEEQAVRADIPLLKKEYKKFFEIPYALEVNSEEDKDIYYQSSIMRDLIDKWEKVDFAIISADNSDEFLYQYVNQMECLNHMKWLLQNPQQSVGRVLGKSLNIEGHFLDISRNQRVLAIGQEQLQKINRIFALATGRDNLYSIIGMLNTGLVTDLYIDEATADLLMNIVSIQRKRDVN